MKDLLPSFSNLTDAFWGWFIPIVVIYVVSKIKATNISTVPKLIVRALIIYFFVTILYLMYGYYQRHKDLEIVRDKTYSYQEVQLDGKSFVNCKFYYCRLRYSGTKRFNLVGSTYDTHCFLHFDGEAIKILDVIGAIRRQPWLGHNVDLLIDSLTKKSRTSPETVILKGNSSDTTNYIND